MLFLYTVCVSGVRRKGVREARVYPTKSHHGECGKGVAGQKLKKFVRDTAILCCKISSPILQRAIMVGVLRDRHLP